jgi:hypothetical protein
LTDRGHQWLDTTQLARIFLIPKTLSDLVLFDEWVQHFDILSTWLLPFPPTAQQELTNDCDLYVAMYLNPIECGGLHLISTEALSTPFARAAITRLLVEITHSHRFIQRGVTTDTKLSSMTERRSARMNRN